MEEKKQQNNENFSKIDNEILTKIQKCNILNTISDEKLTRRAILNCLCELNSEFIKLNTMFQQYVNLMTMVSADKLRAFFGETKNNIETAKLEDKIMASHKKSKK